MKKKIAFGLVFVLFCISAVFAQRKNGETFIFDTGIQCFFNNNTDNSMVQWARNWPGYCYVDFKDLREGSQWGKPISYMVKFSDGSIIGPRVLEIAPRSPGAYDAVLRPPGLVVVDIMPASPNLRATAPDLSSRTPPGSSSPSTPRTTAPSSSSGSSNTSGNNSGSTLEEDLIRAGIELAASLFNNLLKGNNNPPPANSSSSSTPRTSNPSPLNPATPRTINPPPGVSNLQMAQVNDNMGREYYNKGNYGMAITTFVEACKLDPNNVSYRTNLAAAYVKQGNYDKAVESLNVALQLDPNSDGVKEYLEHIRTNIQKNWDSVPYMTKGEVKRYINPDKAEEFSGWTEEYIPENFESICFFIGRNETNERITLDYVKETFSGIEMGYTVRRIGANMRNYIFEVHCDRGGDTFLGENMRQNFEEKEFIMSNGKKTASIFIPYSSNIRSVKVNIY